MVWFDARLGQQVVLVVGPYPGERFFPSLAGVMGWDAVGDFGGPMPVDLPSASARAGGWHSRARRCSLGNLKEYSHCHQRLCGSIMVCGPNGGCPCPQHVWHGLA